MKHVFVISTISVLLILLALPALYAQRAIARPTGEMIIGDRVVLKIRHPAGGMSIQERINMITTRLNRRLGSRSFNPSHITVRKFGDEYAVMHDNNLIITADKETAYDNGTTSRKLASKWASTLRKVIPMGKARTRSEQSPY